MPSTKHYLAPPWGLPNDEDAQLGRYLADDEYGSAAILVRDELDALGRPAPLLLILAHALYRDALEFVPDTALRVSAEALALVDEAADKGAPPDVVDPLRKEIEETLAIETKLELETFGRIPDSGDLAGVPDDVLVDAAYRSWDDAPARAATFFEEIARRHADDPRTFNERLRAALCRYEAGEPERARPVLKEALRFDWRKAGLWEDRRTTEAAVTALLEDAARRSDEHAFHDLWAEGLERMQELELRFPSVWKNQERLLDACLALGDADRANYVARRIEAGRKQVPKALRARIELAASLARGEHLH